MLPIKNLLNARVKEPCPPIMVIDETTIKTTTDAGPVCECSEKYKAIQNYKPFLPGMFNPYTKKKAPFPESDDYEVIWVHNKINERGQEFEKAVAVPKEEVPKNYEIPQNLDHSSMWLHLPRYSKEYYCEKLEQCMGGENGNQKIDNSSK